MIHTDNWYSYWQRHGAKRRTGMPGLTVFWVYIPLIQKVTNRFSFSFFFRKCAIHFWSGTEKRVKIEPSVFLISSQKHEGRAKSAPPSRARVRPAQKRKKYCQVPVPRVFSDVFWFRINLAKKQGDVLKNWWSAKWLKLAFRRWSLQNLRTSIGLRPSKSF